MVNNNENCSIRFRELANRLYALGKVNSETADKSKIQFDDLLKIAKHEYRETFLKFDFKKDRLDEFIWPFPMKLKDSNELCTVCKVLFVLSHGQSFTERGFSINKAVLDYNMLEKSLISQRIVYDTIQVHEGKVLKLEITPEMRKCCRLAHQKYKSELAEEKKAKMGDNQSLKRKLKQQEIQNIKKQKLNIEDSIKSLRKSIEEETLAADKEQDLTKVSKAVAFMGMLSKKETALKELLDIEKKLEHEFKCI